MLNNITIMGRLTRDPEIYKTTTNIPVARFSVAVDRDFTSGDNKVTDFFDCDAWRQCGEFIANNFHKGDMIVLVGSMQQHRWEDQESKPRVNWVLNVERSYFGQPKAKEPEAPAANNYKKPSYGTKRY